MTTSEQLPLIDCEPMESESMLSAEASPARTSASRGVVGVSTASAAGYGASSRELWATFDRASRSWKTSALSLLEDSPAFSETLPRSGMTLNGMLYRLPPLARPIYGNAAGSLLPTPTKMQAAGDPAKITARREREKAKGRNGNGFGLNLAQWAALLPTPTAGDARGSGSRNTPSSKAHPGVSLTDWARGDGGTGRLLPTPRASEWKGTGPLGSKSHAHRLSRGYLDATMQELSGATGRLSPRFVEWMMGLPDDWTLVDWKPAATQSSRKSPKSSAARSTARAAT